MTEYDDKCFDALFDNAEPPASYQRLDRNHMVKQIENMFSSLDRNKKKLYTRSNVSVQKDESKFDEWVKNIKFRVKHDHVNERLNESIDEAP